MNQILIWIQSLGPLVLVAIVGVVFWFIQQRAVEFRAIEESLKEERRKTYATMLDPFIKIFTDNSEKELAIVKKALTSYEHKKAAIELNLFSPDDVIRAHNDLMQHFYNPADLPEKQRTKITADLLGKFLLEIRKSLGNKKSKLDQFDMLRSMLKDSDMK